MELMRFVFSSAKRSFVKAILFGISAGLSMAALLAVTNHGIHNPHTLNLYSAGIFALLIIFMAVMRVKSTVLLTRLSQDMIAATRMKLCKEILKAPLSNLERLGSAKLLATLSSDVASVSNGIMRLPQLFMHSAIVIGCLAYMLWLSWWLFLCAVSLIVAGVLAYRLPKAKGMVFLTQARLYGDQLYQHFRSISEGAKELKLHRHRRQEFLDKSLGSTLTSLKEATVSGMKYYSFASSFGLIIFFTIIGFIVFVLPRYVELESVTLVGYVIVFLFIQGPLEAVMGIIPELAKTSVSLKKIKTLGLSLNREEEDETPVGAFNTFTIPFKNKIELKQVTHSYYRETEDNHFEIGPINLTFKPGELVFLIGGNGSGKTTLAKLLLGLYKPNNGEIIIDGNIVGDEGYDNYRQIFSAVFVDFYLFDQLLGFKGVNLDKRAQDYINKLQLGHKVKIENGKLSTMNLSQGQRKRLALLTAYLEDRQFYVFDEWAADQDPEFKRFFYNEILKDLRERGKTVLVISHDEQYFHVADRYIKMNLGQVAVSENTSKLHSLHQES